MDPRSQPGMTKKWEGESMRIRSVLIISTIILASGSMIWFGYKILFPASPQIFFKTQKPERRDIQKIVNSEGSLEAQGTLKIGTLINATVKKIYVKEGQRVIKNTLLADLENDKGGDADVRQNKALLEQAEASFTYLSAKYKREKALYASGQLAREAFEKQTEIYKKAEAEVKRTQALYDKEQFLFAQTRVYAPHDGTVTAVNIKEGEYVSTNASVPPVLFEIVRELGTMKATLYIDESNVGDVKPDMLTEISVDTYPYRQPWIGKICSIGMAKTLRPSAQNQQEVTYKTEVLVNNSDGLLRPGMSVHAKITIAEVTDALVVPGFVFQLNSKVLEAAASAMHYAFKPMDPTKKKERLKNKGKTLWVISNKTFVEKAVEIGVTDSAYFQILSGVHESDDIIADDMTASEEMKKIAKQFAGN